MGFLILNAMITGLCTGFRGSTFIVLGGRFSKRLREHLFGSLLSQEADFFGAVKTGDITSRLSADCQKVGDQVQLNVQVTRTIWRAIRRNSAQFSDAAHPSICRSSSARSSKR